MSLKYPAVPSEARKSTAELELEPFTICVFLREKFATGVKPEEPIKITCGLVVLVLAITKSRELVPLFDPSITILLPVILNIGDDAAAAEIEVVTPGAGFIVKVADEFEQAKCGIAIGKDGSEVLV
jgi:hypothetical protein